MWPVRGDYAAAKRGGEERIPTATEGTLPVRGRLGTLDGSAVWLYCTVPYGTQVGNIAQGTRLFHLVGGRGAFYRALSRPPLYNFRPARVL